jgi:uncharacterized membrane protein YdcZ (DUF606 family)
MIAKLFLLYWTLLQSMLSSFSGLSSLPVIRYELVEQRHWIDDGQLNAAVMIGRSTPGPMGVYVVCIGYFVAGYWGAAVGMFAMATPALLISALCDRWRLCPKRLHAFQDGAIGPGGLVVCGDRDPSGSIFVALPRGHDLDPARSRCSRRDGKVVK